MKGMRKDSLASVNDTRLNKTIHSHHVSIDYLKLIGALVGTVYFANCVRTPDDFHLISGVNLLVHEAGHFIFMFFGQFIYILGGSLNQVLIPSLFVAYFFLRKEYFSGSIILMWAGESVIEVARYAGDAVVMQLPLLGGDGTIHDWNWLLSTTHLLPYTSLIAGVMKDIGVMVIIIGAVFAFAMALGLVGKEKMGNR